MGRIFLTFGATVAIATGIAGASAAAVPYAIAPDGLVKLMAASKSSKDRPVIIQTGPQENFKEGHIAGAVFGGMASTPKGLAHLKKMAQSLRRDRTIVIYCGCCPYDMCPNIKPALSALHHMGFRHVKALRLPEDFNVDWVKKGYPVVR